jgi:hypothetical protein
MVLCINNLKTFLKNIVSSFKTFVPLVINKTITHTVMINEVEDQTRTEMPKKSFLSNRFQLLPFVAEISIIG